MEDEDKLLADDNPCDTRGASMSSGSKSGEEDPIRMLQSDMHSMATSIQQMSEAWSQIAKAKNEDTKKTDSVTKRKAVIVDDQKEAKRKKVDVVSDSEPSSSDNENDVSSDSESEIENLVRTKMAPKEKVIEAKKGEKSALINEISQEFDVKDKGPKVDDAVAQVINKRWKNKMDMKILREKEAKYPVPENCENLMVPRVNNSVWKNLDRYHRTQDLKFVNTQKNCVAIGSALASCLHNMLVEDQPDIPTMIRTVSDAIGMLGHVNYDLSLKRRTFMRRAISKKYQELCNEDHEVTKWLLVKTSTRT